MPAHLSPISPKAKEQLKRDLEEMKREIDQLLGGLERDDCCILNDFGGIRELFTQIQSTAAASYLEAYLSPYTHQYPSLSIAARNLSGKRHGALIVVQREDELDPWIQMGVRLGAALTAPLLESIFYPGNPLHDGAVWIKEDLIHAAGNVLPLSDRTVEGGESLGTRHRAALGLAERTDALVLVISEETGRISFAVDGKLYPISPELAARELRS
jgi:diadenylate cyclase